MVNLPSSRVAKVIAAGAVVRSGDTTVLDPVTVTAISTFVPVESRTTIVTLPEASGVIAKSAPVMDDVATAALPLLVAYGGTPPPTL
jgi:hypothetical protein